jgi:ABC-2 type transport system ATP-binding protein
MSPDPTPAVEPGAIVANGVWKRFAADLSRRSILQQPSALFKRRGHRWALRDIDLAVAPGEAVGLVGANGSGKSTLLKLLAGVMYPYAGHVGIGGDVGPLIEIQAGLHPELTGGENIGLAGAFLGIPPARIRDRFDDIVEFAELGDAIHRAVRFYSSGMRMRLGFAVATLLQPDVLLIDEVLAVGDASFQQRCLEQLQLARSLGTTLVFVSHDLGAVRAVCERAVWLDEGVVQADGPVDEVLGTYREDVESHARTSRGTGPVQVADVVVAERRGMVAAHEPFEVRLRLASDAPRDVRIHLGVTEGPAAPILSLRHAVQLPAGESTVVVDLDGLPLGRGRYALWLGVVDDHRGRDLVPWHPEADIDVVGALADPAPPGVARLAPLQVGARWTIDRGWSAERATD